MPIDKHLACKLCGFIHVRVCVCFVQYLDSHQDTYSYVPKTYDPALASNGLANMRCSKFVQLIFNYYHLLTNDTKLAV